MHQLVHPPGAPNRIQRAVRRRLQRTASRHTVRRPSAVSGAACAARQRATGCRVAATTRHSDSAVGTTTGEANGTARGAGTASAQRQRSHRLDARAQCRAQHARSGSGLRTGPSTRGASAVQCGRPSERVIATTTTARIMPQPLGRVWVPCVSWRCRCVFRACRDVRVHVTPTRAACSPLVGVLRQRNREHPTRQG